MHLEMLSDKSVAGLSPEVKKQFIEQTNYIVNSVEQDERAIEMTKAQFRQIRQDLRDAKDKAIEKNANYLIEKRLQIIKEKTSDLQTV